MSFVKVRLQTFGYFDLHRIIEFKFFDEVIQDHWRGFADLVREDGKTVKREHYLHFIGLMEEMGFSLPISEIQK